MAFDEFIAMLRARTPTPASTGMHDRDGREIRTGDVVEFWFGDLAGFSSVAIEGASHMIDVVEAINGGLYAVDYNTVGGSFLWKVDGICRVVGDVHTNPEPLRQLMRFSQPGLFKFLRG